jgi:hypothetical protein
MNEGMRVSMRVSTKEEQMRMDFASAVSEPDVAVAAKMTPSQPRSAGSSDFESVTSALWYVTEGDTGEWRNRGRQTRMRAVRTHVGCTTCDDTRIRNEASPPPALTHMCEHMIGESHRARARLGAASTELRAHTPAQKVRVS